jgi:hypothetical protein
MAEIILNKREESTQVLQTLPQNMVESIISKIASLKIQQVFLHADWSQPPQYCQWLFNELRDKKIQTTVCTGSMTALASITAFIDTGMFIELGLERTGKTGSADNLSKTHGLKFFLAVDTISEDGSLYRDAVAQIPPSSKITLGINWRNRMSGPLPINEEDYSAWAATTVAVVGLLTAKKVMSEIGCGLKLCMFSRPQLGLLPTKLIEWPIAHCARSYFYDVDGSLRPCMRLTLPETMSFNYESAIAEVSSAFVKWLAPFSGHCMEADDLNCRSLKIGCCNTGCIEHAAKEWQSSSGE